MKKNIYVGTLAALFFATLVVPNAALAQGRFDSSPKTGEASRTGEECATAMGRVGRAVSLPFWLAFDTVVIPIVLLNRLIGYDNYPYQGTHITFRKMTAPSCHASNQKKEQITETAAVSSAQAKKLAEEAQPVSEAKPEAQGSVANTAQQ